MRKPRPARSKDMHYAAPLGGWNTVDPISELPITDATLLINHIGGEGGLAVRPGYKEQATGLGGEVRSIIPYTGAAASGGNDRLFAATQVGIFNVSGTGPVGAADFTFATQDAKSGYGSSVTMVTSAGRFLAYCDESNGYIVRPEAGGVWAAVTEGAGAGQISGVNPGALVQCVMFKGRMLFVEKDSTRMWFLAPGSIYGAASPWDFGREFAHGGSLAQLAVWTVDGGAGADDVLVAISTAGDVVLYSGTDPATLGAFQRTGGWFVGGVPVGRRLTTSFGGELLIATVTGVLPVSRLPAGRTLLSPDQYATYKVRHPFAALMQDRSALLGWSLHAHPSTGALIINVPKVQGEAYKQFAMSLAKGAWFLWRDYPIFSADVWHGRFYFGTADGRVCFSYGFADNVAHDGSTANAKVITFMGFSAFRNLGTTRTKQVHRIDPITLAPLKPNIQTQARFDFDLSEITLVDASADAPIPTAAQDPNVWDNDAALWAADDADPAGAVFDGAGTAAGTADPDVGFLVKRGAVGMGTHVAVAWKGETGTKVVLIGFNLLMEMGGLS